MATDYAGIIINASFTGVGIVIGTTIAELYIKPLIQKWQLRYALKRMIQETKEIIKTKDKKQDDNNNTEPRRTNTGQN